MKNRLLFVEDSALVLKVMRRLVLEAAEFEADFAESLSEARSLLQAQENPYFAAVVDLNLPDAPSGEVVDLMIQAKIPTIVLTASYDPKKREGLLNKGIVDYVVKENRYSYGYAMKLVIRLKRNRDLKVIVVDDSLVARKQAGNLLRKYQFQVIEADGAKAAIRHLIDEPEISLVITDYHMPEVDGFELVKLLRGKYDKQNLTIIGLSGEGDAALSARFIKHGANDFLRKPFNQEEFYCRVMHNVESMETVALLQDANDRDQLTGLYNREQFYSLADEAIFAGQNAQHGYALAIMEIDEFRHFNNVLSDYGDTVLQQFADEVKLQLPDFIAGRLNGSQLVVLMTEVSFDESHAYVDDLRQKVKQRVIQIGDKKEQISISVGLCYSESLSRLELLEACDLLIERANDAGKDLVIYD